MQGFDCGRLFGFMGAGKKGCSASGDLTVFSLGCSARGESCCRLQKGAAWAVSVHLMGELGGGRQSHGLVPSGPVQRSSRESGEVAQ